MVKLASWYIKYCFWTLFIKKYEKVVKYSGLIVSDSQSLTWVLLKHANVCINLQIAISKVENIFAALFFRVLVSVHLVMTLHVAQ